MGTIISSKLKTEGKVIFELLMDHKEAAQLKGTWNDIHIFSEKNDSFKTKISTRGKNASTKYLLIPRGMRKNINLDKEVICQKIELKDKIFFISIIKKI